MGHRMVFHQGQVAATWSPWTPASRQTLGAVAGRFHELGLSHAASLRGAGAAVAGHLFKLTAVAAFEDAFLLGGAIVMAAMIPALFLPAHNIHRAGKPESIAVVD